MKKINCRFFLLILLITLVISCGDDDKSSTEPEINLEIDQALVGTWDLTKITANFTGQPIVMTPEQAGISTSVTFKNDGSFESTSTDSDGTSNDTGTWGVSNGVLTININGEEPDSSPYTINGNVVSIVSTVPVAGVGEIPATLEFTKRM